MQIACSCSIRGRGHAAACVEPSNSESDPRAHACVQLCHYDPVYTTALHCGGHTAWVCVLGAEYYASLLQVLGR